MQEIIPNPVRHLLGFKFPNPVTPKHYDSFIDLVKQRLKSTQRLNLYLDLQDLRSLDLVVALRIFAHNLHLEGLPHRLDKIAVVHSEPEFLEEVNWSSWFPADLRLRGFEPRLSAQAWSWVESSISMPQVGFSAEFRSNFLFFQLGQEITIFDLRSMARLVHRAFEQGGPVNLLVQAETIPKLGSGLAVEHQLLESSYAKVARLGFIGPKTALPALAFSKARFAFDYQWFPSDKVTEAVRWASGETEFGRAPAKELTVQPIVTKSTLKTVLKRRAN